MTNRELFELHFKTIKDFNFYIKHEMTENQVLEFKCGEYVVNCVNEHWQTWQAATQRDGFKFVPINPTSKMIVAIEKKVEQQLGASAITQDPFRLDGEEIFWAMMEVVDGH